MPLPMALFTGGTPAPAFDTATLYGALGSLGLTGNLVYCLDAADSASYGGSGQTFTDLSGNGNSFYLGAGSGSESTDPTFNGTAGNKSSSEYFSTDGGDYFTLATTNPASVDNIHKDSAKWTWLAWWYAKTSGSAQAMFATTDNSGTGIQAYSIGGANTITFYIQNAGSTVLNATQSTALTDSAWHMLAISMDEAAATGFFWRNSGTDGTFTSTYSSPSSGAATYTLQQWARNGAVFPASGWRFGASALWSGTALTTTNLGDIRTLFSNPRYGV